MRVMPRIILSNPRVPAYRYSYGTRLRYVTIIVNTTIDSNGLGYEAGMKLRDAWDDFANEQMKAMPDALKGGFQVAADGVADFNLWHWIKVQQVRPTTGSRVFWSLQQ